MNSNVLKSAVCATVVFFTFSCNNDSINGDQTVTGSNGQISKKDPPLKTRASYPIGMSGEVASFNANAQATEYSRAEFNSIDIRMFNSVQYGYTTNSSSWGTIQYAEADAFWQFAKDIGARMHGHCLVYHLGMSPGQMDFVKNSSVATVEASVKLHIENVLNHFKNKGIATRSYDVINEVIQNDGSKPMYDTTLYRNKYATEDAYYQFIKKCFTWARQADPDAKLFYNDYKAEASWATTKKQRIIALLNKLKAERVTINGVSRTIIDGVGTQTHIGIDSYNEALYETSLKDFVATGLLVHVSELDVCVNENDLAWSATTQFDAAKQKRQSDVYRSVAAMYQKNVPSAQRFGITMWDFCDADTWFLSKYGTQRPNSGWEKPNMFWADGWKKPAYYGLASGILGVTVGPQ
jgi:endo-1,4-beta-xylanase